MRLQIEMSNNESNIKKNFQKTKMTDWLNVEYAIDHIDAFFRNN